MDAIPDYLVDHLSVAGTLDDVTGRLIEIAQLGIQEFAIWPFPPDGEDLRHEIVPLSEVVIPRVLKALER
jgi:alkanesulfonate monooxygenase SsuD/methylene tetrahydromethanopterin reductase-like flavin-dependent oxidoreductase (luciferase family)